jgi:DNA processing protein
MTPKKLRIALLHEDPEEAWARAICDSAITDEAVARICERCEQDNIEVVYIGDPNYPRTLRYDPTPPAVLFYRGSLSALQQRRVGIVGTRSPTPSGVYTAREFGEQLAANEIAVVSGLARGIDGAVHHGMKLHYEEVALASHGALGKPIGVVACGLDVVYPKSNAELWAWVGDCGLLVSEYGPGVQPEPYRFPQRISSTSAQAASACSARDWPAC